MASWGCLSENVSAAGTYTADTDMPWGRDGAIVFSYDSFKQSDSGRRYVQNMKWTAVPTSTQHYVAPGDWVAVQSTLLSKIPDGAVTLPYATDTFDKGEKYCNADFYAFSGSAVTNPFFITADSNSGNHHPILSVPSAYVNKNIKSNYNNGNLVMNLDISKLTLNDVEHGRSADGKKSDTCVGWHRGAYLGGVCTEFKGDRYDAGFTNQRDPLSGTCAIRLVEEDGTVSPLFSVRSNGKTPLTKYLTKEDHDWDTVTDCTKNKRKCKVCGYTETSVRSDHSWDGGTTTNATCGTDGKTVYKCKNCKQTKTVIIPATGKHVWQTATADVNNGLKSKATCTAAAQYYQKCKNCSVKDTGKFNSVGSPLPHKIKSPEAYTDASHPEATVYEKGWRIYRCRDCSYYELKQDGPKKVFTIYAGSSRIREIRLGGRRLESVDVGARCLVADDHV